MTPQHPTEREKLAHLIRHWIDHNEGHRRSYLEWRDKLEGQNLPRTYSALGHIADLTREMNQSLRDALDELE
ncbi:MAG: hypothetical protein Kow00129_05350 [Thermoleophilia bacterium]